VLDAVTPVASPDVDVAVGLVAARANSEVVAKHSVFLSVKFKPFSLSRQIIQANVSLQAKRSAHCV
jgi:hypothetical protein